MIAFVTYLWLSEESLSRNVYEKLRVIRSRRSKDRQHIGQKKKDKQWSTKTTQKTKEQITWTPLQTGMNSSSGTRRVTLVINTVKSHGWGKDRITMIAKHWHILDMCDYLNLHMGRKSPRGICVTNNFTSISVSTWGENQHVGYV